MKSRTRNIVFEDDDEEGARLFTQMPEIFLFSSVNDGLETAVGHALAVERQRVARPTAKTRLRLAFFGRK